MNQIRRSFVDFANFLDDHLFFTRDIARRERGIHKNVRNNVDCQFEMFIEHHGMITRLLARGKRVERAAERFHRSGDLTRGALSRPLEQHVFDHVRGAFFGCAFVARSDVDPYAKSRRADCGDFLRDNSQTARENGFIVFDAR